MTETTRHKVSRPTSLLVRTAQSFFLFLLIFVLNGCASTATSKSRLSRIAFGDSAESAQKVLKTMLQTDFRVATTNGVLEMRSCASSDPWQHWFLLFLDGKFVSSRPSDFFPIWGAWPGFSDSRQPDFNEVRWFWRQFDPPERPATQIRYRTNSVTRRDSWEGQEAAGMLVGMAPFLPFLVVAVPMMYASEQSALNKTGPGNEIQPGMEEARVIKLMGRPKRTSGHSSKKVLSYSKPLMSIGIDDGRVAFVFFGCDVAEQPAR
jgi:hypothetical protein